MLIYLLDVETDDLQITHTEVTHFNYVKLIFTFLYLTLIVSNSTALLKAVVFNVI